ncbi:MAG: hypothetical protein JO352_20785 [Chloroflexi bacterium]|nr:hypothetical protein [Chloroflexota bacterium]MBV9601413.1 hypothetical protein [Chloroflexota bacterium]
MSAHTFWTAPTHEPHQGAEPHPHGPGCGHPSAVHANQHVDYLVDGHAHHAHEGHWDECDPAALARVWQPEARS